MKIGAKIRELRISRNMTQEQLAEKLFVSFQTISKWETETTNPDLSQIVRIARLFQVTTDELFDFNESTENLKRAELEKKYMDTFKTGDVEERINVGGEVLKEYPNDMEWRIRYAWDIWCAAFEIKDDQMFSLERDKAIELFKSVIEGCDSNDIRGQAIVGIVQCLNGKGCHEEARKYAEMYPDVKISAKEKNKLMVACMSGEEKQEAKQHQLLELVYEILQELIFDNPSSESFDAAKKILKILFPDENYQDFYYYLYSLALSEARKSIDMGNLDKAIMFMKKAKKYADSYDEIPREYVYSSPLFDKIKQNRDNWCLTVTRTMAEEFANLLDYPAYASLKEHPDYQSLSY